LLGLKGTWSERERPPLRARLPAGLRHKAKRGDLALSLPLGLVRNQFGKVQQTPDREVPHRLERLFATVLRVHTASQVLQCCTEPRRSVPGRDRCGALEGKPLTVSAILSVLKNPAYAGAFVSGRSQPMRHPSAPFQATLKPLPLAAWKIRVHDKSSAYMRWEPSGQIRALLTDHDAEDSRHKTRGIPRAGAAAWAALWRRVRPLVDGPGPRGAPRPVPCARPAGRRAGRPAHARRRD
jgi:hypothetical protein